MKPRVVSRTEAGRMLKISDEKMLALLEAKEVGAYKDGNVWKVPIKCIEEYIDRRLKDG